MNNMISRPGLPTGWKLSGTMPENYQVSVSPTETKNVLVLMERDNVKRDEMTGFGTVMQSISAEVFIGKRVQLSALVKVTNVPTDWSWAGLWMRIDGKDETIRVLDNMYDRRLFGTTDWVKCVIVLDVAPGSAQISFGILLHGCGEAAVCDVAVITVSEDVQITKEYFVKNKMDTNAVLKNYPVEPVNLSFD